MSYNPNGPRNNTGTTYGTGTGSMGTGTTDLDVEVDLEKKNLRAKAEELATTVKDKASQFGSTVSDKASQFSSTVSDKANAAVTSMGEKMTDMGHALRDKVPTSLQPYAESIEKAGQYLQRQDLGDFVDDVSGIIRRHPMPAMMTGIALGFLLARTAKR
jgi:ElaB/YqjD/DUF883 family membrane-anchored ribosome-binding protein